MLGKVTLNTKKGISPLSYDISMLIASKKLKVTSFAFFNQKMSSKKLKKIFFCVFFQKENFENNHNPIGLQILIF